MIGENLDPNQPRDLSPMRVPGYCGDALLCHLGIVNLAAPVSQVGISLAPPPLPAVPLLAAAPVVQPPADEPPPLFTPPRKRRLAYAL